jgi:hypothetical protein
VTAFYNDCLNAALPALQTCDGSDLSTSACFHCLASQPSSPTWGAVILYDNNNFFTLNVAGCYSLIGASAACSTAQQEQNQCEAVACDNTGCEGSTNYSTCISTADTSTCSTYTSAVTANCPTSISSSATCGGTATTFKAAYQAVAKKFCE